MDEITKRWFDVSTVKVERSTEAIGWHSDEELIRLAGAPSGSRLFVSAEDNGKTQLLVENEDLLDEPMVRYIVQEPHGYTFHIVNHTFAMKAKHIGGGIGSRSVCIEIMEAARLGYFNRIRAFAVGDHLACSGAQPLMGYFMWPRMGFDGPIPATLLDHSDLPPAHANARRLVDLMTTKEGQAFWKRHGSSLWLEFDLSADSASWKTLRNHLAAKRIEVET